MKKKTRRNLWKMVCAFAVIFGIIDFYLNWIRNMETINWISNNLFSLIGIIGLITLISSLIYWKLRDINEEKKQEKEILDRIIKIINNHADCLKQKEGIKFKDREKISNFYDIIEPIEPEIFDLHEFNRDNK